MSEQEVITADLSVEARDMLERAAEEIAARNTLDPPPSQAWHLQEASFVLDAALPGWRNGKIQWGLKSAVMIIAPFADRKQAQEAAFTNDRVVHGSDG